MRFHNTKFPILLSLLALLCANSTSRAARPEEAAMADTAEYKRLRVSATAELLGLWQRTNSTGSRATLSAPTAGITLDLKITPKWIFSIEADFAMGSADFSPCPPEKEDETAPFIAPSLQQFHFTRLIIPEFNVRVGHFTIPVALSNAHDDPMDFFSTVCPGSDFHILPSGWRETGINLFGTLGSGHATFDYQLMLVTGLNASGLSFQYFTGDASSAFYKFHNIKSPGYALRIDYTGVEGLSIGGSVYYCHNTAANSTSAEYNGIGTTSVTIGTLDATYRNDFVTARANISYGHIGNTTLLNAIGDEGYVAKNALSYEAEAGLNITRLCGSQKINLYPFLRYSHTNPQAAMAYGPSADKSAVTSQFKAGVDWFVKENLVVKADYTFRRFGSSSIFNASAIAPAHQIGISIGYVGSFNF